MSQTSSCRLALRYGAAAALAGLLKPATAEATPSGDDAELIALCAQFDALERQIQGLPYEKDPRRADAPFVPPPPLRAVGLFD